MNFHYKSDLLVILQERGFLYQITHPQALDDAFRLGKVTAYCGFDATASSLHVGNLLALMVARWMQALGHKPILLLGGGTSKVGDPSWRDSTRPLLTDDIIQSNIQGIQSNLRQLLHFEGENPARLVNNADWLDALHYISFLREIGVHFSVNRMLSLEHVASRLEKDEPLSFIEFNYLLMQSYDFLKLYQDYGCTLQWGGSDQWGNIVSGVDLVRRYAQGQVFGLTMPLTTLKDGSKMGKTAQGAVWMNAELLSPYAYWQFWRNVDDVDVVRFLKLYTMVELSEIQRFSDAAGEALNEAKILLADCATALIHGSACLGGIHRMVQGVFAAGDVGDLDLSMPHWNILESEFLAGITMVDVLEKLEFVSSRSEARRKLAEGAVKLGQDVWREEVFNLSVQHLPEKWAFVRCGKKHQGWIRVIEGNTKG